MHRSSQARGKIDRSNTPDNKITRIDKWSAQGLYVYHPCLLWNRIVWASNNVFDQDNSQQRPGHSCTSLQTGRVDYNGVRKSQALQVAIPAQKDRGVCTWWLSNVNLYMLCREITYKVLDSIEALSDILMFIVINGLVCLGWDAVTRRMPLRRRKLTFLAGLPA